MRKFDKSDKPDCSAPTPASSTATTTTATTTAFEPSDLAPTNPFSLEPPTRWWRTWWRSLSPSRQDKLAAIAPLVSVALFLLAIALSFWYLRTEELEREQEALIRAADYAQQRTRMRLLERQEQLTRLAQSLGGAAGATSAAASLAPSQLFSQEAEPLIQQYPELQAITWLSAQGQVRQSKRSIFLPEDRQHALGSYLPQDAPSWAVFEQARQEQRSLYHQPLATAQEPSPLLQLYIPLWQQQQFAGALLAEYSVDKLLRYATPSEVLARYTVHMLDAQGQLLSTPMAAVGQQAAGLRAWAGLRRTVSYSSAVTPVGEGLVLHAQAHRSSPTLVGNGLFWLVGFLSVLTAWLLLGTSRHTRKRLRTQEALMAETNFRRAMEDSIPTGMRALDLQGRITYVNTAFCQMTGWSEAELVGQMPPYPYWPQKDWSALHQRLQEELLGNTGAEGFQVTVQRKDGSYFDAHMAVSRLIDAHGQHTGWMSSMTDITESLRIRNQLSASHERFTIVLEALDASVSVAPLGSHELLFANKLYRQWFEQWLEKSCDAGNKPASGHLQLVQQAGALPQPSPGKGPARQNAEIYQPELGKWLEVRSRYITWADGRLAQMVIATDISARRSAEAIAAQQAERAQTTSRLITMGEMASSVAHELNQPLTAISNYCSGLLTRLDNGSLSDSQMRFALEKTAHQAQRAGQIIQHIRSFVKRSDPQRAPAQVQAMVDEALELANIEMRRRNVRLSHHLAARLPPVMADAILIEQVLINLMKNAAEAIDNAQQPAARRSIELRVRPKTWDERQGVEFAIEDSGPGLPPEVLERLFEAFFSTKSEGMGMGLNLCRSIIEAHNGRLQAQNLYNGTDVVGCCFSFWIPLASTSTSADTGAPTPTAPLPADQAATPHNQDTP
ncbi:MAG: PAS domain S-box protein [Comamonas sp.]|nr:PAS domain S-box protein [Comamonas sp.]